MNIWLIIIIETVAVTVIGSLLHFAYEWSGEKKWVAVFAAVNESTWEHVKLALSGIFCCTLVDIWFLGDNPNYWLARSVSFVVPVIVIPIIFYGYTAFTRRAILPVDILTFAVAAFLSSVAFVWILEQPPIGEMSAIIAGAISVVILAGYLLLTFFPIKDNLLFQDPVNHKYGIEAFHKLKLQKSKAKQRRKTK